jgi:predicted dehydrogenase
MVVSTFVSAIDAEMTGSNNTRMTLRLAIVGCGAIAEQMHIPAAQSAADIELTAVVDADADRARRTAAQYGIARCGTTIAEIADAVDAVVLCTPPHVRPQIAEQAFAAGLHVMCEKPFANTVTDCDRIIAASQRAQKKLAVAHIFRFWPSRKAVKDIIDSEEFGKVLSVTATQGNPYSWGSVTGYNMRPGMVPGGVLFDAGIHPLDTLLWWFGKPTIVDYQDDALGGLESNVRLTLSFPSVPEVRFRQSRTAPMTNEFRLHFEDATVVLSNYSPRQMQIVQVGVTKVRHAADEGVDHTICERNQLLDFTSSIAEDREPAITGAAARKVIELVENCYQFHAARSIPNMAPLPGLTR